MNRQPLTDAEIAELVHDAADGWTMPPIRLDAPAWRERVRSPRARRAEAIRGWVTPFGRAATGAIALTVAAALVAVVITGPPNEAGKSPGPSDGATPGTSDAARSSPLPDLIKYGDVPSPSTFPVQVDPGSVALVDVSTGTIGRPLEGAFYGSRVQVRTDGYVCLCLSESGSDGGSPTNAAVTLVHYDLAGAVVSSKEVETFIGEADARDATEPQVDPLLPNVTTAMGFSPGNRYGFVGWSFREGATWRSGMLAVELLTGEITDRIDLPEVSTGDGSTRRFVEAPQVISLPGDDLVIGRTWVEATPQPSTPKYGAEAFRSGFRGGAFGTAAAVPGLDGCGDRASFAGPLADGGTWVVCTRGAALETRLRRVAADGSVLPDTLVIGGPAIAGDASAINRDGTAVFAWDPWLATLTRIDTATGEKTTGQGITAVAETSPLSAFGRWLAPAAAAKAFLLSSVILSPDGSRVYAIGVTEGVDGPENIGSAGVFVFDSTTLALLATYEPTADFDSLTIDPSGRFLYAAGMPRVDERGASLPDQGASITIFDTTDGSVRLIAGQLGPGMITFRPEPLE